MYSTIIMECQTKKTNLNCENCIAHKMCNMQEKLNSQLEIVRDEAPTKSNTATGEKSKSIFVLTQTR
jgi:hypothetical protein